MLELDATLTFAPFGLKLLGVEYPASFSPAVPPPNIYPLLDSNPPPAPSAFATPSYLFADEGVNVDPSELFSWLFEVPSGTQGPFAFAVELLVWPPSDDVDRVVLSARTSFTPVPEPGTGTLLAAAGLSWLLRPRRRSPSGSGRRAWIVPIDREAGRRAGRA